jgi:hypothetical protein
MDGKTHFAPALRSTPEEIGKKHKIVSSEQSINEIFRLFWISTVRLFLPIMIFWTFLV